MKKVAKIIIGLCLLFFTTSLFAQDTLPNFTVRELKKGVVQISWINPFSNCNQLVVQRSYDSLKFFVSIFSAQSPALPQNGFVDNDVAPGVKAFYRVFYVLENGDYHFTKSISTINKKEITIPTNPLPYPTPVEPSVVTNPSDADKNKIIVPSKPIVKEEPKKRYITVYRQTTDTVLRSIEVSQYKKFKDSIATKTKDTLFSFSSDEFIWKPFVPKPVWKPSQYIFTTEKGLVKVALPQVKQAHYDIKFFDENDKLMFEVKRLKEDTLILDKTNFIHSGWFYFELYENEKLKEKNKFFVGRDF